MFMQLALSFMVQCKCIASDFGGRCMYCIYKFTQLGVWIIKFLSSYMCNIIQVSP